MRLFKNRVIDAWANKALYRTAIPLRSIAAGEFCLRYSPHHLGTAK